MMLSTLQQLPSGNIQIIHSRNGMGSVSCTLFKLAYERCSPVLIFFLTQSRAGGFDDTFHRRTDEPGFDQTHPYLGVRDKCET